ncbi:MAG: response regulator [Bacillota bacterium]
MNADKSLHILHIEDDESHAEMIWKALDKSGLDYRVTLVMTRESYKNALREGDVDIVLSDSRGYDFEGVDALRYVRKNYPGIPFLFLSGSYVCRDPNVLKAEGAAECLLKGQLRGLVPAIQRAAGVAYS